MDQKFSTSSRLSFSKRWSPAGAKDVIFVPCKNLTRQQRKAMVKTASFKVIELSHNVCYADGMRCVTTCNGRQREKMSPASRAVSKRGKSDATQMTIFALICVQIKLLSENGYRRLSLAIFGLNIFTTHFSNRSRILWQTQIAFEPGLGCSKPN